MAPVPHQIPWGAAAVGKQEIVTDRDPDPWLADPFLLLSPYPYILSYIYLSHPTSKMEDLETYQTPLARSDPFTS